MFTSGFFMYVFVSSFTPGPNNIMSMNNASKFGFANTVRFVLGAASGFFLIALLCGLFNVLLLEYIPAAGGVMNGLGCLYMLFLAYAIATSKPGKEGEARELNSFRAGVILQFLNAKGILYALSAFSAFVLPFDDSWGTLFLTAFILGGTAVLSAGSWALFGGVFNRFLNRHRRSFQAVMALMLVYGAVSVYL
ncbi:LysE family transporter [Paenibacillus sp. YN15]|uniref:LysE family transporter n=1 Tax=Paenibacillus sp. YN15 TaxID=1742774 RepID=UPI000DCB0E22|nr:LysE family transporter [Paenibacillus sp. YN15]RAU93462.1 lysine transporter LysE [Paenibacillus sp. YN15]